MATETQTKSPEQAGASLYPDITRTTSAIEQGDWLGAGMGGMNVAMDIIGVAGDPTSAIASAGFGWILEHIKFLREPFDQLLGDPNSIMSMAGGWDSASRQLTTAARDYKSTAVEQTRNWHGEAADAYRKTASEHADSLDGLAAVSKGVGEAVKGAGQILAEVRKAVLDMINKACMRIVMIIIEALAEAYGTFGASIAKGIAQSVQTAVQTAQQCFQKIAKFVQQLQKLLQLVQKIMRLVQSVQKIMEMIGGKASGKQVEQTAGQAVQDVRQRTTETPQLQPAADGPAPTDPAQFAGDRVSTPPLPHGVPSWGPSGPPPDRGHALSRVELARVIDQATKVLSEHGVPASKMNPDQIASLIEHESSRNPHAINLWDSNAKAGHPSKGLMQTIDSTFTQYKLPGHDNIYAPVDNVIAGVRYSVARYGSISNVPGVRALNQGRDYVGY